MGGARIVNLCEVIENEKRDAFKWAASELLRMDLPTESIDLIIDESEPLHDVDGCVVSIFHDDQSKVTFMRCDYPDKGGIKYIIVNNYDYLKRNHPVALEYYTHNGLKIYRFFDGKHGGITHLSSKKYCFA